MRILRIFPRKTSLTPIDGMTLYGGPDLFVPPHDEVHISTVFTWDLDKAEELKKDWQAVTDKPVRLGGPAYASPVNGFVPGRYIKPGVTFTSRGCPRKCSFCLVPEREGALKEIPITEGNIIQDNNLLACSDAHIEKVINMLRGQKSISFRGGLESRRITPRFVEQIRGLRIKDLWLACDTRGALKSLKKAVTLLKSGGFTQSHIRCYVLIGDDLGENEERLKEVFRAGALPFAQLYQPKRGKKYSKAWRDFARQWSRPAIYKSIMGKNND